MTTTSMTKRLKIRTDLYFEPNSRLIEGDQSSIGRGSTHPQGENRSNERKNQDLLVVPEECMLLILDQEQI